MFVERTKDKTTSSACKFMTRLGNMFGVPKEVRSDLGPAFRNTFTEWLKTLGVDHQVSSSFHPQGNGLAERKVQSVKTYLDKLGPITGDKLDEVVLEINRTRSVIPGVGSPMERFLGWTPRIPGIPSLQTVLTPIQKAMMMKTRQDSLEKEARRRGRGSREDVKVGDRVRIQDIKNGKWSQLGTVESLRICEDGGTRSVVVQSDQGRQLIRNSKYIRLYLGSGTESAEE